MQKTVNFCLWFHRTSTGTFSLTLCLNRVGQNLFFGKPFKITFNHSYFFRKSITKDISMQKGGSCMSTQLDMGCNFYCSWLFGILQISKLRVSIITANSVTRKDEGVRVTKEVKLAKVNANHSYTIKNTSEFRYISPQGYKS